MSIEEETSSLSTLHVTKDFLNAVTKISKNANSLLLFLFRPLSFPPVPSLDPINGVDSGFSEASLYNSSSSSSPSSSSSSSSSYYYYYYYYSELAVHKHTTFTHTTTTDQSKLKPSTTTTILFKSLSFPFFLLLT